MDHQKELEYLRRDCSTLLELFIARAGESERRLRELKLPVTPAQDLKISERRRAEFEACHEYILAVGKLDAFLRRQLETVQ